MYFYILSVFISLYACANDSFSLSNLLALAIKNNGTLSAAYAQEQSQSARVISEATPEDPMIGIAQLNRGTNTQYAMITQKIRFPVKYALSAKIEKSLSKSTEFDLLNKKWKLRQDVTQLYYAIYSKQKILQLTEANREAVKEFARVAERKYAANQGTQGDSMKAHFEITQLDLELIRLKQEEEALQYNMKALVNDNKLPFLDLAQFDLNVPIIVKENLKKEWVENAPELNRESQILDAMKWKSSLSKWEFAPDFQFQFQQRINGQPLDSQIYSVNFTVPLFFWKKRAQSISAGYIRDAQDSKVMQLESDLAAQIKDLLGRVQVGSKTLKIYETSLIPQANGTYNSTKSAYQAGKTSFLNLLDSERTLYRVRTSFYRSLEGFIRDLTILETKLGSKISDLEMAYED